MSIVFTLDHGNDFPLLTEFFPAPHNYLNDPANSVFLLTAPFDENAKTGDGQYAVTLVHQFQENDKAKCIWLKQEAGHYSLDTGSVLNPIPANTVPSIYVLQKIANGQTAISGYVCPPNQSELALERLKGTTSPRGPKIIVSTEQQLLYILYRDVQNQEQIISLENIINALQQSLRLECELQLQQLYLLFTENIYSQSDLIQNIECLSGLAKGYLSFDQGQVKEKTEKLPRLKYAQTVAAHFKAALSVAQQDKDRQHIISQLISTMKQLIQNGQALIDIHLRPPETGGYIMPEDIRAIKKAGISVNLTIHEYKQNYTRRHLQDLTHSLMREANTVLFFNEKDRKNACKAAESGFLDSDQKSWRIESYNLINKTGLTVASQILSGIPPTVEEVLNKEASILIFGTIRNGKVFEEALQMARLLKSKSQDYSEINKVIVAGDPQSSSIMNQLFEEKYGYGFKLYLEANPYRYNSSQQDDIRDYWQTAKRILESQNVNSNPYLEIHPWCEHVELDALKQKCKYVCRIDDMGMRNNGSAIISVLDVGIVYAKNGCVTDDIYKPGGIYESAVDIGEKKYGKHHKNENDKSKNGKNGFPSRYKRAENSRPAEELLDSIRARELNQSEHNAQKTIQNSSNYKTVQSSQSLLKDHFRLNKPVEALEQMAVLSQKNNTNSLFYCKLEPVGWAKERSDVPTVLALGL